MVGVFAILPAHNEEKNIGNAVKDLLLQTVKIEKIIVVADNCSDGTVEEVKRLCSEYADIELMETKGNHYRKAGAINMAIDVISDEDCEFLLVMDSDSRVALDLVERAMESFESEENLGGVCSTAHVIKPQNLPSSWIRNLEARFMGALQRLEYAGFDAERVATWNNVTILHGLCAVYRFKAIKEAGGYTLGHLIEDYDLTVKLKKLGWQARFNPKMVAWTEVPLSLKSFFKQRLRWMRGGIDVLVDHGINRITIEDAFHHFLFICLLLAISGFIILSFIYHGEWRFGFNPHPIPILVAIIGYLISLYKLRYLKDARFSEIILRIIILPELLIAIALMGVRTYAYFLALFKCSQEW